MRAAIALAFWCLSITSIVEGGAVARRAAARFQRELPEARLYQTDARITRVYGPSMGFGATPREAADAFIENHSEMFGVQPADLRFDRSFELMYGKFTAVQYIQVHQGIEVRRPDHAAGITILTRADVGNGIVLVSADLYDMLDVRLDPPVINGARAIAAVAARDPDFTFTAPELAVFVGGGEPILAHRFAAQRGDLAHFEMYEFFVDATRLDSPILHQESLVYHIDVEGNTSGWASQGMGSDVCAPDGFEAMPYTMVNIQGGESAFADAFGDFVIPHGGLGLVTVESAVRGRYFRVFNQAEDDTVLRMDVTPPGPANFEHDVERVEFKRAEVNAYIEANVVRDHALRYSPDYPVIREETEFPVNVNIDAPCNAYYNTQSINFYRSAESCPNTAYGTVVHHEYGHHLVRSGGSGQGQYGEGAGDVTAMLITDDPRMAPGFFGICDQPLRTAENDIQYPCEGGEHACGRLLSACVWDTRNELVVTEPDAYRDILGLLWFNSIPLHRGNRITPQIAVDLLTLDDDDDDIFNGTPHFAEIDAAFRRHNMEAPRVAFDFPNGLLDMVAPAGGDRVRVEIEDVVARAEPGTGMFHYRINGDFAVIPMEQIEHNVYDIVFPPTECGQFVPYFVSVETTDGDTVTEPKEAPDDSFEALSTIGTEPWFADDFERDTGWTVVNEDVRSGPFERAVPFGRGGGAPEADYDGSGQCYVTGNEQSVDLDGGPTRLISPVMDLAGGMYHLSYARYFLGRDEDSLTVEVSTDAGQTWQVIEVISSDEDWWHESAWILNDLIEPTSTTQFRFSGIDAPSDSVVELAVDAFLLTRVVCGDRPEPGWVLAHQKISAWEGDFTGYLENSDSFGYSVASLGDLDGDGVADLAVGAIGDDDGGSSRGAVWVLFLNGDGTVKTHQKISDTVGGFDGILDDYDRFGTSVASLGDLDGDGVTDLAVGAYDDDDGGSRRGAVWVLFLNSDGTVKTHQKISDTEGGFTGILDDGDLFGFSLAALSDLDGDGVDDLAVGAMHDDDGGEDRGAVWILFLNADGTVNAHQKISDTEGGFTGTLDDTDRFGHSMASLADLDGDGVTDLAVGAPEDDDGGANRGGAWLLFLNADGTVKRHQKVSDTEGGFTGILDDGDRFGDSVSLLSDLDGDGVADLAVGAVGDDDGSNGLGAVWVLFLNGNGTVKAHQKISDTMGGFAGGLNGPSFGSAVASLGDLDGDGVADLAVGKWLGGGGGRGAIWVLFLDGVRTCVRDPVWQCDGDTDGDGQVNPVDSGLVQSAFGSTDEADLCQYDMDCDGQINPVDSGIVQSLFGSCDPPRNVCP